MHLHLIQLLLAPGWRAHYYDPEKDQRFSAPLIGWGLHACGCVLPIGVGGWDRVSDLTSWNMVGLFREDEDDLPLLIQSAIDDWKAEEEQRKEAVRSTAN